MSSACRHKHNSQSNSTCLLLLHGRSCCHMTNPLGATFSMASMAMEAVKAPWNSSLTFGWTMRGLAEGKERASESESESEREREKERREREKERKREREKERKRERDRERKSERAKERKIERGKEGKRDREKERKREREKDRERERGREREKEERKRARESLFLTFLGLLSSGPFASNCCRRRPQICS